MFVAFYQIVRPSPDKRAKENQELHKYRGRIGLGVRLHHTNKFASYAVQRSAVHTGGPEGPARIARGCIRTRWTLILARGNCVCYRVLHGFPATMHCQVIEVSRAL